MFAPSIKFENEFWFFLLQYEIVHCCLPKKIIVPFHLPLVGRKRNGSSWSFSNPRKGTWFFFWECAPTINMVSLFAFLCFSKMF
jgi:hypothetical protein